ncbi:hypothetical protein SCP_0905490 [Sparassis crispa]|uniref:Uncharacterized protein n=1 Tax=Sparassis crispa TaxID=139825 RepID=A0A401GWX3_9APHY|nr:hypothetical protein SCP_0905490 [Sparassis crispa]GBE86669.1 hypothetical protein SCP_0905490 [Sparassis crispa]
MSAAAMQSRFRLNPQPPYSQKMSETRSEIRRIIREALQNITGDRMASMRWPSYWKDIVQRYHVMIVGWPEEVPFKNLSQVSNLAKLEILLRKWQNNETRFRRITDAELTVLSTEREARIEAGTEIDEGGDEEAEEEEVPQEGSSSNVGS